MHRVIFYSWQSDLPNATNRGFIQDALENAAEAIRADATVDVEPVIDRDTQGMAGSPDIATAIFDKISRSDLFLADVSITSRPRKARPSPNPNVLIELGYALKALGHERIILVFNRSYGKIEELPFDLKMRRVTFYDMPPGAAERAPERTRLTNIFQIALQAALAHVPIDVTPDLTLSARTAIENNEPNRVIVLRRALGLILHSLESMKPKTFSEGGIAEDLIAGITSTQNVVGEFSKLTESIAVMNDTQTVLEIHKWFGQIFEKYDLPRGFNGQFSNADFDFFKFLGHELYVTFIAFLLRERRWNSLVEVLDQPISVSYLRRQDGPGDVSSYHASVHLPSLTDEGTRRRRISLHADILSDRHSKGYLKDILPTEDFMDGDYFLFLRSVVSNEAAFVEWYPWSVLYLQRAPAFLRSAENARVAQQLAQSLTFANASALKAKLLEVTSRLNQLFSHHGVLRFALSKNDIERIGSRS